MAFFVTWTPREIEELVASMPFSVCTSKIPEIKQVSSSFGTSFRISHLAIWPLQKSHFERKLGIRPRCKKVFQFTRVSFVSNDSRIRALWQVNATNVLMLWKGQNKLQTFLAYLMCYCDMCHSVQVCFAPRYPGDLRIPLSLVFSFFFWISHSSPLF